MKHKYYIKKQTLRNGSDRYAAYVGTQDGTSLFKRFIRMITFTSPTIIKSIGFKGIVWDESDPTYFDTLDLATKAIDVHKYKTDDSYWKQVEFEMAYDVQDDLSVTLKINN